MLVVQQDRLQPHPTESDALENYVGMRSIKKSFSYTVVPLCVTEGKRERLLNMLPICLFVFLYWVKVVLRKQLM